MKYIEKIMLLSKILYKRQKQLNLGIGMDPEKFKNMIESDEPKLKGFFDELVNIFIPSGRVESNKKPLVGFCYLLVRLRNGNMNSLQLEVGFYLE